MSAPRPYETYPFHPPALFLLYIKINFYLYTKLFQFFFHVVLTLSLETMYICHLRMRSFRTTYFKVHGHFEVILSSVWYVLARDKAR